MCLLSVAWYLLSILEISQILILPHYLSLIIVSITYLKFLHLISPMFFVLSYIFPIHYFLLTPLQFANFLISTYSTEILISGFIYLVLECFVFKIYFSMDCHYNYGWYIISQNHVNTLHVLVVTKNEKRIITAILFFFYTFFSSFYFFIGV